MASDRPNILLISTDEQRYDTLGVAGNTQVRTPHLDALSSRGAFFERPYIQNTVCIPSRACLQTGRYTHQHGVTYMEAEIDLTPGLPEWEVTFMERLQAAGYRTGATGKMHMMPQKGLHYQRLVGGKGSRWTEAEGGPLGPGPLGPTYASWLETRHPGGYEAIYEQRRRPDTRARCRPSKTSCHSRNTSIGGSPRKRSNSSTTRYPNRSSFGAASAAHTDPWTHPGPTRNSTRSKRFRSPDCIRTIRLGPRRDDPNVDGQMTKPSFDAGSATTGVWSPSSTTRSDGF